MAASGKPRFVEIGANLLDGMFRGRYHGKRAHGSDLTTVLDRAAAAGMSHLMITASNLKQARLAHAMCLRHNAATGEGGLRLFCTVGVHPTNTTQLEFTPKKTGGAESTATPAAVGGAAAEPCCSTAKHSDDETDLEEQLHEAISRPSTGGAVAGHAPADAGAASAAAGAAGRAAHTALHSQPKSKEEYVAALDELIAEGKRAGTVVAIGECGLDYDRLHFSPKEVQLRHFELHFDLAERHRLPLFLHDRNTGGDFGAIMRRHRHRIVGGVVHSFTGTSEEAAAYLDLGLHIGINGCSLKTEANLAVVRGLPLDKLMLETDAPWCDIKKAHASHPLVKTAFPTVKKEKYKPDSGALVHGRCEPCQIVQVAEVVAALHGVPMEAVAHTAYATTVAMFFPAELEAAAAAAAPPAAAATTTV